MSYKSIRIFALLPLFIIALIAPVEPAVATTWSGNVHQLTDYPYFDGSPSITQTSDNKIWIVWTRDVFGYYTLYYNTTSDYGATWSKEKNLTATQGVGDNISPSIMESANGTIWVLWASNRPKPPRPDFYLNATPASLTIPRGETENSTISVTSVNNFNDIVALSTVNEPSNVTTTLDPTEVTPPPNGTATSNLTVTVGTAAAPGNYTLIVIGSSGKLTHIVDITLEITESSEAAALTDTSSSSSASFSASAESLEDFEIFYKTSDDYGATWSNDLQLTDNTVDDINPSAVQLTNGTIMVVWQSTRDGNSDIFYKTTSDGISWSDETPITTLSGPDESPSIIQAKDKSIWLAWASGRTGDYEIFYKIYDGLSWSNATRLTNSTNVDTSPSILQTIDEKTWIFWTSSELTPTATGDIYYMHSSDNGTTWSDSIQFTTDSYEDAWPAVTQTRFTKIWVVWTSNRADQPDGNWEIYYRTSLVGDINGDGVVNTLDISLITMAYRSVVGEPEYNPDADINKDGIVDMRDAALACRNYGST